MTENPNEKQSENYQFINEKIIPKRKSKWMKKLETTMFVVFLAVIFGVVSQAASLLSKDCLKEWLDIEDGRQEVNLPKKEPQSGFMATPTPKQSNTPTPVPTKTPETTQDVPKTELTVMPETTITPAEELLPEPTEIPEDVTGGEETSELAVDYLKMYEPVRKVAEKLSTTFVTVEAIEQGVDWFQETYEKRSRTTGLILGNDGIDLLILVGTEQFTVANSIEVFFGDTLVSGRIYAMDKEYGLAVIAVPLNTLSEEILAGIQLGLPAEEEDIMVGMPVIALGAPNGYENSVEFGMITSLGSTIPVTDGEVAYFTTDITEYPKGFGYVVNPEGKVLGLITHTHKQNPEDGIFTAISLDSVRGVMVKLLNNTERVWFGIKGQDIPKNLALEYGLETGVYIGEVETASPALNAGIKAGDILVAVNGEPVSGIREFSNRILNYGIRDVIQVTVLRKTEAELKETVLSVLLAGKEKN